MKDSSNNTFEINSKAMFYSNDKNWSEPANSFNFGYVSSIKNKLQINFEKYGVLDYSENSEGKIDLSYGFLSQLIKSLS